jgi:hypothetical protein
MREFYAFAKECPFLAFALMAMLAACIKASAELIIVTFLL